ncbi:MAG: peptide-methionine (S)-S-oxide reductase MsrA [Vicinamibacterales bacterium]
MKLSDLFGGSVDQTLTDFPEPARDIPASATAADQTAVLAGGCFWCTEAVFLPLEGVIDVSSGYAGGTRETANYETVCSGTTEHAEAIQIRFDPKRITFGQLLKVFFAVAHDPTHVNRQGNDRGRQYRSAIFYADEEQRSVSEAYIKQLSDAKIFPAPMATTLEPLEEFYQAELYHQNYVARNPNQPYVAAVAIPKVQKLRKVFAEKLKQ